MKKVNMQTTSKTLNGTLALTTCGLALALTGCGAGTVPSTATTPVQVTGAAQQGIVMGGQQPVGGVTLQLYQAGINGAAATAIGSSFATTASGNFNFPAYTCATGSQIFLVGTGGQPIAAVGSTPAVTNNNLALMTGLGTCGGTYLNQFVNVNELTTVATVWALAPFMTSRTNIGASANNATGLANAFAVINEVVNTANGALSGPALPSGATLPVTEINTLADILEQCINSGGGSASDTTDGVTNGTGCGKLFYLAKVNGVAPTDTITAALNIARNPSRNVSSLNQLRSASPVFAPTLSVNSPPSAWTIAINYIGGGLSAPSAIATDAGGNIWATNNGNSSVSELAPSGAALSGSSGFLASTLTGPTAIAIDPSGDAWVTTSGTNALTKIAPGGTNAMTYYGNGLNAPSALSIDGAGNIFVTNATSVSAFTNAGNALGNSPYALSGAAAPIAIAVTPK